MIARVTAYRTPALEPLTEEIVALARSSGAARIGKRRVELFLVDRASGGSLSVLLGDDRGVTPVIDLARAPSADPEEYDVHLLQVGGPRDSGVVEALVARLVRCDAVALDDLSFDGDAVPKSPDVWMRALLIAPDGAPALAVAVGSGRPAVEESLRKFSARCDAVDDYEDVAYHFFVDAPRPT